MLQFKSVYLSSNICHPLVSQWRAKASISCSHDEFARGETLILPPMPPTPLKIEFKFSGNGEPLDAQSLEVIASSLNEGIHFWQNQLLYECHCRLNKTTVKLELRCKVWNTSKMSTLLQRPKELRPHMKLPSVAFCTELQVKADFHHLPHQWGLQDVVSQFNEYLSSLIVSQLEFQLPFVFSIIARNRFKAQEKDVGPISYSLTHSSALIPLAVQLIATDKTATTIYQLIRPKRRTNRMQFQILSTPH